MTLTIDEALDIYDKMKIAPLPPLHARMIAKANDDNLPADHPMRVVASELHRAILGTRSTKNIPAGKILGTWARARRIWCDYTGEPLT